MNTVYKHLVSNNIIPLVTDIPNYEENTLVSLGGGKDILSDKGGTTAGNFGLIK